MRETTLVLVSVAILSCSAEPRDLTPWSLPVPQGARVVEYAEPHPGDRADRRIEVERDLVIGHRGNDSDYLFYGPSSVNVDDEGTMYVLDAGNRRVQVFDRHGEFLHTLGKPGQGPGEFERPSGLAASGDRVFVGDSVLSKITIWENGAHVKDVSLTPLRVGETMSASPDGGFVADLDDRLEDGRQVQHSVLFSPEGEQIRRYASLPIPSDFVFGSLTTPVRVRFTSIVGRPVHAVSQDGNIYISALEEYQVLALNVAGRARWALRVAGSREAFTERHRDSLLERWSESVPDPDPSGVSWPAQLPALSTLLVDGHSHLYVFPYAFPFDEAIPDRRVDVYSSEGDHLFSGYMPPVDWTAALGDFIYAVSVDQDSSEREPVRYRLIEPFE